MAWAEGSWGLGLWWLIIAGCGSPALLYGACCSAPLACNHQANTKKPPDVRGQLVDEAREWMRKRCRYKPATAGIAT
jgi:hypothetical protein